MWLELIRNFVIAHLGLLYVKHRKALLSIVKESIEEIAKNKERKNKFKELAEIYKNILKKNNIEIPV